MTIIINNKMQRFISELRSTSIKNQFCNYTNEYDMQRIQRKILNYNEKQKGNGNGNEMI